MNTLKFKLTKLPENPGNPTMIKEIFLKCDEPAVRDQVRKLFGDTDFDWENVAELRLQARLTTGDRAFKLSLRTRTPNVECSVAVDQDAYLALGPAPQLGTVVKMRYVLTVLHYEDVLVEVDQHIANLNGLLIAIVTYDPARRPDETQVIDAVEERLGDNVTNVTEVQRYEDRTLALLSTIVQTRAPKN